jgi:xanthine dehydrogenase YagS FAD-binding subunit
MRPFSHANAADAEQAVAALGPLVRPIAGGIDLLHLMKAGIEAPQQLVNLKTAESLSGVKEGSDGLRVGALTPLSKLADHRTVSTKPELVCLREALNQTASPQIRHMATLGGNLLQRPRCWYYRNRLTHCWLKGGPRCFAVRGENKYHAVLGRGACQAVNPSDAAVSLAALGALVTVAAPGGSRTIPLLDLYRAPTRDARSQTTLGMNEVLTEVVVPAHSAGCRSAFVKVSERSAWDFALVSVAVVLDWESDLVRRARVVLGGVAPMPWRVRPAEAALVGQALDPDAIARSAEAAIEGARPLEHNAYKLDIIQGALRQALRALA